MAEKSGKLHVEVSDVDERSGIVTRERNPAAVFERLHRSSRSKQAPDNQEQKEIDASEFDAEDEYYKGVPEGTERP